MKSCCLVVTGLICLVSAACRTDPNIALLERELRMQEDQIYQLKESLDDYQATIDSCRRENSTLRKRLTTAGDASDSPRVLGRAPAGSGLPSSAAPPSINLGVPAEGVPDTLKPRKKGSPAEDAPSGDISPPVENAPGSGAEFVPGPTFPGMAQQRNPESRPATGGAVANADSRLVNKIVLNRLVTGGYKGANRRGDKGVVVVVEPQDEKGQYLAAPADVSVVVLDPELEGQAARVARWDFSAAEIASRFSKTPIAQGIQLEMPWPADPPVHDELRLFVRYTTSDGRRLQAERAIKITPPDEAPAGLTPNPASPQPDTGVAGATGPVLGPNRSGDAWRRAPAPEVITPAPEATVPTREASVPTPPMTASRTAADPTPRTAALPSRPDRGGQLKRPVWSPERQ